MKLFLDVKRVRTSLLGAVALASCWATARAGVVPPDLVATYAYYYKLPYEGGTISEFATGWLQDRVDPTYYISHMAPSLVVSSDQAPGAMRVGAFTLSPDWAATLQAVAVMNEFISTGVAEYPALRIVLEIDGEVTSTNQAWAAAWLDIFPNALLTSEALAPPELQHPSSDSSVYASAVGPIGGSDSQIINQRVSFLVPYENGGYAFALLMGSRVETNPNLLGSTGSSNFLNTIRIVDVTLPDGRPVPGGVTFDSGFQLAAVPEPSSMLSAALGLAALAGYAGRRRICSRRR